MLQMWANEPDEWTRQMIFNAKAGLEALYSEAQSAPAPQSHPGIPQQPGGSLIGRFPGLGPLDAHRVTDPGLDPLTGRRRTVFEQMEEARAGQQALAQTGTMEQAVRAVRGRAITHPHLEDRSLELTNPDLQH